MPKLAAEAVRDLLTISPPDFFIRHILNTIKIKYTVLIIDHTKENNYQLYLLGNG